MEKFLYQPQHLFAEDTATLGELTVTLQLLNEKHRAQIPIQKISVRLEPLISFVERYAKSIDVLSQGFPIASVIWGLLRVVLEMASSASRYFQKVIDMLERLGSQIGLYARYEELFERDAYFSTALVATHLDIIDVLGKARRVLGKSKYILVMRTFWRNFESDFKERLDSLNRRTKCLDDVITYSHRREVQQRLCQGLTPQALSKPDQLKTDVLDWIASRDVSADLLMHSGKRLQGTGLWISKNVQFCNWRDHTESSMLWISGASGTGKSVLAAHVVRHLVDFNPRQPSVTAFYFFDRSVRLQRPLEALVAAILSQLVHQTEELDSTLVRAYETSLRFGRSRLSHLDDPLSLMKSMAVRAPRLDIVLDGLDECDDPGEILTAITELLQDVTNVHAIVLSRNIPRVGIHLGTVSNIPLDTVEHRRDIECFVHQSVAKLMLNDSKLEEQVASVVKENADGMFLWAVRVMESLHAATNPSEVLDLLKRLPPNINTYYDLHLQSLTQEHIHRRRLGMTVLRWMCCVVRPLSWAELQCSLALNEMRTQPDAMQTPFQSVVLEVCTPFVALDAVSKTIRLQHHSAREFLLQKPRSSDANSFFVDETETHHDLAEICLRQLLAQPPQSEFTQYATLFWLDHVLRATCTIQLRELVLKLVCDDANFERWLLDRVRWDGQRAHSTHKIIGSLSELNIWMQSSPNTTQLQNINWTAPIVRALLGADEHGVHEKAWLGHFEKLMIVRDIARILTQSKMLDEGITWFEDALRKRQQTTHGTSSHWIMSALGILYDQKNEIQRSLDLHAHVLTLQEKMTGRESLETLWTVNEMGRVYRHLGDYAKAEEQHNRALTSLKKILPHEHSEVIWTLNTLARAYRKSGKLTEALALHLQAVAGQERVVGPTHPHPLWTRGDIGKCYFGLRRFGEAELSFRLALKGRITLLGEMHVDTLWTMAKLGCVLATTTTPPPQEAFELLARALEGQMVALGAQHTQTIKTAVVLRELESRSGRGLKACAVVAACTLSS